MKDLARDDPSATPGGLPTANGKMQPMLIDDRTAAESHGEVKMKKNLNLLHGVAIIVGIIIGSGIFITPVGVLLRVGSSGLSLIIWAVAGLVSILSAICFAEFGTMIKRSGGEYIYVMEGLGRWPAFIVLLFNLIINSPTPVAVSSLAMGTYILKPFFNNCEPPILAIRFISIVAITLLTGINSINVKWAAKIQVFFTVCKLAALAMIIVIGFMWISQGRTQNLQNMFEGSNYDAGSLALAFYSGYWSFGGWNYLNFLVEEIKNPVRNLPLAIVISISVVTCFYLMANVAYMTVLTTDEMIESAAVAVTFAERTIGPASWIVPIFVACSVIGAMNGGTLATSRIFFVGGEEGQLPEILSMIHAKYLTPVPSLLIMCIITLCLSLSSDMFYLLELMGFAFSLIFAMSMASLLYLRWKKPEIPRPIKIPIGLPIGLFLFSIAILLLTIYQKPVDCAVCLCIVLGSIPLYWLIEWKNKPKALRRKTRDITFLLQKLLFVVPRDKADDN